FPDDVHVVQDKESTRLLGAQVGNGIDPFAIWEPLLEDIKTTLDHCNKLNSPIEERCRIAQMIVGSKTQYFTQMNDMPPTVLKQLSKIMKGYLRGGKTRLPVNIDMLMAPREEGGL
ncbi:hypothetical protein C8F01DRAFT_936169, partial [Mycena amicta]